MRLSVTEFTDEHVDAVQAFNARLRSGDMAKVFQFPESPVPAWLPPVNGEAVFQQYFVAVDDGTVRGGFILKRQEFWASGHPLSVANYQLPISEGIVDCRYAMVGLLLLADALKREPRLYALGLGGRKNKLPQILKASGWALHDVPFYFRVLRGSRVLRQLEPVRANAKMRVIADIAAATGLGAIAFSAVHAAKGLAGSRLSSKVSYARLAHGTPFGAWADDLWRAHRGCYTLVGARDACTLNILYPCESPRFIRIVAREGGRIVGWAVLLSTPMESHHYFGSLHVGTIVDVFAAPEHASAVIYAATRALEETSVDIIVSNQCNEAWTRALEVCGYLRGPSNFIFAVSPALREALSPFEERIVGVHMNRGDGDGPINL